MFIDYDELKPEIKQFVDQFEDTTEVTQDWAHDFMALHFNKYRETYDDIISNEIDMDDLKLESGKLAAGYGCPNAFKMMVESTVRAWFTDELKELIEERNYRDEDETAENRRLFDANEARAVNSGI